MIYHIINFIPWTFDEIHRHIAASHAHSLLIVLRPTNCTNYSVSNVDLKCNVRYSEYYLTYHIQKGMQNKWHFHQFQRIYILLHLYQLHYWILVPHHHLYIGFQNLVLFVLHIVNHFPIVSEPCKIGHPLYLGLYIGFYSSNLVYCWPELGIEENDTKHN